MMGVLTNFKDWIFTKYSLLSEFENEIVKHQEPQKLILTSPFEVSQTLTILDDEFKIKIEELQKVIQILEWLSISFKWIDVDENLNSLTYI